MEHEKLKNLYEEVVAGKFLWDRWSLLGVLSSYIVHFHTGDILEIGAGESSIWLSTLAKKHNRKCFHVEYSRSGIENMKNTKGYFSENSLIFNMKSDAFFQQTENIPEFCLSFIDGDHTFVQVRRDFKNAFVHTCKNGFLLLHDTLPPDNSWKVPHKCGEVHKLLAELKGWGNLQIFSFGFGELSSFGVGLTMIQKLF